MGEGGCLCVRVRGVCAGCICRLLENKSCLNRLCMLGNAGAAATSIEAISHSAFHGFRSGLAGTRAFNKAV